MKKLTFIILFIFSSFILFAQTATPPAVGDGSSGSPYQIATLDNLYWLSQNSAEWIKHYIQTADIDASSTSTWDGGAGFSPIGNAGLNFFGSYNGQFHTIDGLYINRPATDNVGMFGWNESATIKNLGLTNINITGYYVVGGLVGDNRSSHISNSYTTGSVSAIGICGGLVGTNFNSQISNSYSTCSVSVTLDGTIGGLVGSNIIGSSISSSYATGSVSGIFTVGGLVGDNSSTINNSFWDTESSGLSGIDDGVGNQTRTESGVFGKSTTEMRQISTFTDESTDGLTTAWDFEANPNDDTANDNFWDLCSSLNGGYPILSWQNGSDICLIPCTSGSIIYNTETNKFNFCEDGFWTEK